MLRHLVCVCLLLAGCAGTKQTLANKPIRVSCEARTFEQAKTICFSNAIEFAVGAVVVASTEIRKRSLVRDDILKHSSGYVDDYTIEGRIDEPNRVMLIMDVTVKQSKIAERIMGAQAPTGEIQGQRLDARYSSYMNNRNSGDKVLGEVIQDFPKFSFIISKGEVLYHVDNHRNPVVIIPYTIKWNYKYLVALNEALAITQDQSSRTIKQEVISVSSKDPDAWILGKTNTYYFNDLYRAQMVKRVFVQTIYVNVTFKDGNGRVLKAGCDDGHNFNGPHITDPFRINGNEVIEEEMHVTFNTNKHKIAHIAEVELSLSTKPCRIID